MVGIPGDARALVRATLVWSLRWALLAAIALAAVALAAAPEGEAPAATVEMTAQMRFEPATLRVQAGQRVQWKNVSSLTHTVTADPSRAKVATSVLLPQGAQPFHSGMIGPGGSWTHAFQTPGTYRYFCMPHEGMGMVATVEVTK